MKKKIVILGSTGSIGKNLINIIANDKKRDKNSTLYKKPKPNTRYTSDAKKRTMKKDGTACLEDNDIIKYQQEELDNIRQKEEALSTMCIDEKYPD